MISGLAELRSVLYPSHEFGCWEAGDYASHDVPSITCIRRVDVQ